MKVVKTVQTEKAWWENSINENELLKPFRNEWETYHWNTIFNKMISLYDFDKKAVFEGGCGTGLLSEWLVKRTKYHPKSFVGMDLCDKMVKYAEQRNKGIKNTRFYAGNVEQTKLSKNTFDVCIMIDALHHVPDLNKTLKELKRIGRDLILSEPNALNPVRRLNERQYRNQGVKEISFYLWELKHMLREVGYKKIHIYHQHFIPNKLPLPITRQLFKFEPFFSEVPVVRQISGSMLIIAKS